MKVLECQKEHPVKGVISPVKTMDSIRRRVGNSYRLMSFKTIKKMLRIFYLKLRVKESYSEARKLLSTMWGIV
jgi:hypothetical protein